MRRVVSILILTVTIFCSCQSRPETELTVHSCAALPEGRACATCFVVNGEAYIFAGRDSSGTCTNDLWRYNPASDHWTHVGSTPLSARVNATACVHGEQVYIGLGFNGRYGVDSTYLQDWWSYTPATDTWQRLADYPNSYTDAATAFADTDELYVGYGFCWNYRRDMFRYTIAENRWDSIDVKASFDGYPTRSFGGTGCSCAGRHYMGTGYRRKSLSWWAELVDGNHWEQRAAVPGPARTLAASAATASSIYLCGGLHYGGVNTTGEVLQDVRRYDPATDRWTYVAVMPERLCNHICFAIHDKVYFGLGENEDWQVSNRLYYIEQ